MMPSSNKKETAYTTTSDPEMVLSLSRLTGLKTVSHARTPQGTMTETWGSPSLLLTSPQTWVSGTNAQFQMPQKSPSSKRRITRRSSVYVKIDQAAKKLPSASTPTDKYTEFKVPSADAGNSIVRRSRRSSVYRRALIGEDDVFQHIAKGAKLSPIESKKVLKIIKKSPTSVLPAEAPKPPTSTVSSRKRNLPAREKGESPEKPVPKRRRKETSLTTPQTDEYTVKTSQLSVEKKTQKVLPEKRHNQKTVIKKSLRKPGFGNIGISISGSLALVPDTEQPRQRGRKSKTNPQSAEDYAIISNAANSKQPAKTTKGRPTKYQRQIIKKMTDETEIESLPSFKKSSRGRNASNIRKSSITNKQLDELNDLPDASKCAQNEAMEEKFQSDTSSTFKIERSKLSSHRSPVDERIMDILRAAAHDLSAMKQSDKGFKQTTPRSSKSIKKSVKSSLTQNKSSMEKEASKKTKSTFIHTASTPTHAPIAARKRLLSPLSLVKNYAPVYEPIKEDNLPGTGMLDNSSNTMLDSKDVLNSSVSTSTYSSRCAIL